MSESNLNVIGRIVKSGLCSACGVCAGVCPQHALSMCILPNGDLAPVCDERACKPGCNLCLSVCPFMSGLYNPRPQNQQLFAQLPGMKFDEDIGWYQECLVGYRKNHDLRRISASGGLLTWCLEKLIEKKLVDGIAVVRFAPNREEFFEFFCATTIEELRQAAGSVYYPVAINDFFHQMTSMSLGSWAIVGVPCLCAAVRKTLSMLRNKVKFVLGLACGMYQNRFYTEMLLAKSGISRDTVSSIEYRRKAKAGRANDYRFRAGDSRRVGEEIAYLGLPYFLGKNGFFRQNSCNFCMDVFAETADACFMDACLPAYITNPMGTSLVIARNPAVLSLISQGMTAGDIHVESISSEDVVQSQRAQVHRKRVTIALRAGISAGTSGVTFADYLEWCIQRYCMRRSKQSWKELGRKYGTTAFWLGLLDAMALLFAKEIAAFFWRCLLRLRLGVVAR